MIWRDRRLSFLLGTAIAGFVLGTALHASSVERIEIGRAEIVVRFPTPDLEALHPATLDAIRASARAIFKYLGRFPRKRTIEISYDRDSDGTEGTTFGGTRIEFELGTRVKPDYLAHDWVLAHEMIHLVFPDLDDRYRWMEEGLAVYVGNLARERDGLLLEQDFWSEFLDRMPEGLPKAGDQGLDRTHTWGRTYWGGALFWFLADLEIHKRTHNRKSVRDILRGILAEGGDGSDHWTLERLFRSSKKSTGTDVLREYHARFGAEPGSVDLQSLWGQLGIRRKGAQITYDPSAPFAANRQSITAN